MEPLGCFSTFPIPNDPNGDTMRSLWYSVVLLLLLLTPVEAIDKSPPLSPREKSAREAVGRFLTGIPVSCSP
jgi:hypothetical protein